jgi:outer membrane protein OmpA-like peptidoglycan-associated protein
MQNNPTMKIGVNGHTDDVGTESDNQRLSQDRAISVKNFLLSNGIEAGRITSRGFGESKPIDSNSTEQGRANNRRTEIEILSM